MEKELNKLLKHALTPSDEPDFWLNQRILNRAEEEKGMIRKKKRIPAAVLIAVMALCMGSVTVCAAWKYLAPERVAGEFGDGKLAAAFAGEGAVEINESQSYGGYDVTLLGIVSGEDMSEYQHISDGNILSDRTYAVVAIENADGTPMPDTSEEAYSELAFFMSPLIAGYNPVYYNAAGMHGGYAELVEGGVLYRLVECDNIEAFADHNLYLCVSDGDFFKKDAYHYDKTTGVVSRNEQYDGLNALFNLPIDASKADPKKAAEYIEALGITESDIDKEKIKLELEEGFTVEAVQGNEAGAQVAEYALQFVGNPYMWGEDSLTEGADSSGFTKSVYEHFDISLPHSSVEQRKRGYEIEGLENAQPGDLIFYEKPTHVAVYIGDGKIVHAYYEIGICISEAKYDTILTIRRIVGEQ